MAEMPVFCPENEVFRFVKARYLPLLAAGIPLDASIDKSRT